MVIGYAGHQGGAKKHRDSDSGCVVLVGAGRGANVTRPDGMRACLKAAATRSPGVAVPRLRSIRPDRDRGDFSAGRRPAGRAVGASVRDVSRSGHGGSRCARIWRAAGARRGCQSARPPRIADPCPEWLRTRRCTMLQPRLQCIIVSGTRRPMRRGRRVAGAHCLETRRDVPDAAS
jgi:hypothetical protein